MGARLLRREGGGRRRRRRQRWWWWAAAGGPRARAARLVACSCSWSCFVVRVVGCSLYEYCTRAGEGPCYALLINQPAHSSRARTGARRRAGARESAGGPLVTCNARARRRERQRGWRRRWAPLRGSCRQRWSSRGWDGDGQSSKLERLRATAGAATVHYRTSFSLTAGAGAGVKSSPSTKSQPSGVGSCSRASSIQSAGQKHDADIAPPTKGRRAEQTGAGLGQR